MKKLFNFIFLLSTFAFIGCTSEKSSHSNLEFKIPLKFNLQGKAYSQKSATAQSEPQSGYVVERVIINVRGGSIQGLLDRCWAHKGEDNCQVLPQNGVLRVQDVPTGGNALIQILIVAFQEDAEDNVIIYYGDAQRTLVSGDVAVTVPVTPVTTASGSARIRGRYLNAAGTGPTGKLDMYLPPINGKPAMRVTSTEIFAGWFGAFSLYDKSFSYRLRSTGEELLPSMDMSPTTNPYVSSSPNHVAMVQIPQYYKEEHDDQGNPLYEQRGPERLLFGYFGPGAGSASGLLACIENNGDSAPGVLDDIYPNSDGSGSINWNPNVSGDSTTVGAPQGGALTSANSNCTDFSNLFSSFLFLSKDMVEDGDFHHATGFYGPFRAFPTSDGDMDLLEIGYDPALSAMTFDWEYLPGMFSGSSPISGVQFYLTTNPDPELDDKIRGDRLPCKPSEASALGFSPAGSTSGSTSQFSLTGVTQTDIQNDNFAVLICPYRNNAGGGIQYFGTGFPVIPGYHDDDDDCNSCGPPPELKLVFVKQSESYPNSAYSSIKDENISLAKDTFENGSVRTSWVLAPAIGRDGDHWVEYIGSSDIDTIEYAVNGGVFNAISNGNFYDTTLNGNAARTIRGDALFNEESGSLASVSTVRFRVKVTSTFMNDRGLDSDTIETGDITLVPTSTCNPANSSFAVNTINIDDSNSFLTSLVNLANFTDQERTMKLEFSESGCSGVSVPIAQVNTQGPRCISWDDFYKDPSSSPFEFKFSPIDISGADCSLLNHTFNIKSIYFNGADVEDTHNSFSGTDYIRHSTINQRLAPFLTNTAAGTPGSFSWLLEAAHLGPNQQIIWTAYGVNDDFKITDNTETHATNYWEGSDQPFTSSFGTTSHEQNLMTKAAPGQASGMVYKVGFTSSDTKSSEVTIAAANLNQKFIRSSNNFFDGGSPIFLALDLGATNFARLLHWPQAFANYGSYEGEQLENISPTYGATSSALQYASISSLKRTAHIATYRPDNGDREHFVVSVEDKLIFGSFNDNGTMVFSNAVPVTHTTDSLPMEVLGLAHTQDPEEDIVILGYSPTQGEAYMLAIDKSNRPFYDRSANNWVNVPIGLDESADARTGNLIGNLVNGTIIGLRQCAHSDKLMILGKNSSGTDQLRALLIDSDGTDLGNNLITVNNKHDTDFNEFVCAQGNLNGNDYMVLVPYSTEVAHGNYTNVVHLWDLGGSACGTSSPDAHHFATYSPDGSMHGGANFIPSYRAPGMRFFFGGVAANNTNYRVAFISSCASGAVTFSGGETTVANLPVGTTGTQNMVHIGVTRFEGNLKSGLGHRFFLTGSNSQIYQVHPQEMAP